MSRPLTSSASSINSTSTNSSSLFQSAGSHSLQNPYGSTVPPPLQSIPSSRSPDIAPESANTTTNQNQRIASGDISGNNDHSVVYPPSPTITPVHSNPTSIDQNSSSPYHIGQTSNNANFWTPLNGNGISNTGNTYGSNPAVTSLVKGSSVSPPASSPIHHQGVGSAALNGGSLNGSAGVGSHYGSSISHAGAAYNSAAMAAYRSASDPYYHAAYDLTYFGNTTTAAALNQQYASHMNAASAAASSNMFRGIDYGTHPDHAYPSERYQPL